MIPHFFLGVLLLIITSRITQSFTTISSLKCSYFQRQQFFSSEDFQHWHKNEQLKIPVTTNPTTTKRKQHRNVQLLASQTEAESDDEISKIVPASAAVGIITAAMGFIYGKALGWSVSTLWKKLPNIISTKFSCLVINPLYYITGVCTIGGLLVGCISSTFKSKSFTVAEFVSVFSASTSQTTKNENTRILPRSRDSLFPLLLLSLLTSTFGFSVGPEAPMVCAGALVGASLARKWYKIEAEVDGGNDYYRAQKILAYAGAAGALTAFMGIPFAGSIFALELTRSNAGLTSAANGALSPAVVASIAAIILIRGILVPGKAIGGHFAYGSIGFLSGRAMIITALASGVGGAIIGTIFHKLVKILKSILWQPNNVNKKNIPAKKIIRTREVLVKTIVGLFVGLLSSFYPQTMFWGEGSLQCMIDGQKTAFLATRHGLPNALTNIANVNPSLPFNNAYEAMQVGIVKLLSIALACAGKFPGGIIFPLFFSAAPIAHALGFVLGGTANSLVPVMVMCLMAATQASVTRTPLATVLILSLSASATTELSIMLPACLVASYTGVWVSELLSKNTYFQYSE